MWRSLVSVIWALMALALMMTGIVAWREKKDATAEQAADTLRVTVTDTVRLTVPVVRDSVVVRYVVRRMEKPMPATADSTAVASTGADSADVVIPITNKTYSGEDYTAWVSGYMASLDSIAFVRRTERVTIRDKPKRWSVGIQAGIGVGTGGGLHTGPYVGIGVTYNLFSF